MRALIIAALAGLDPAEIPPETPLWAPPLDHACRHGYCSCVRCSAEADVRSGYVRGHYHAQQKHWTFGEGRRAVEQLLAEQTDGVFAHLSRLAGGLGESLCAVAHPEPRRVVLYFASHPKPANIHTLAREVSRMVDCDITIEVKTT